MPFCKEFNEKKLSAHTSMCSCPTSSVPTASSIISFTAPAIREIVKQSRFERCWISHQKNEGEDFGGTWHVENALCRNLTRRSLAQNRNVRIVMTLSTWIQFCRSISGPPFSMFIIGAFILFYFESMPFLLIFCQLGDVEWCREWLQKTTHLAIEFEALSLHKHNLKMWIEKKPEKVNLKKKDQIHEFQINHRRWHHFDTLPQTLRFHTAAAVC